MSRPRGRPAKRKSQKNPKLENDNNSEESEDTKCDNTKEILKETGGKFGQSRNLFQISIACLFISDYFALCENW